MTAISFYDVDVSRLQGFICNLLALNDEFHPGNLIIRSPPGVPREVHGHLCRDLD